MEKGNKFNSEFNVSEEIYSGFIQLFNDENPLHTDTSFAMSKGFKGVVMHGNILNGFLSFFVGELLPIKNVIIQTQSIKFLKPVYMNDKLMLNAEIVDVHESVNTVEFKFDFSNSKPEKVARGTISVGII